MQAAADEVKTMHPFSFLSICMPMHPSHKCAVLPCDILQLKRNLPRTCDTWASMAEQRLSAWPQQGYQLGKEMMCNSHRTGAVAFNVLQMLLERPATKSSCHPSIKPVPSRW